MKASPLFRKASRSPGYLAAVALLLGALAARGMSLEPMMDEIYAVRDRSRDERVRIDDVVRRYIPRGTSKSVALKQLEAVGFKCYRWSRPQDIQRLQTQGFDEAFSCTKTVTKWSDWFVGRAAHVDIYLDDETVVVAGGEIVTTPL